MPNECTNTITIYADEPTAQILLRLLISAGGDLRSLVKEHVLPENSLLYNQKLHRFGAEGLIFTATSNWGPPIHLLKALFEEQFIWFMKNEWCSEDGSAGVFIAEPAKAKGAPPLYSSLQWDEGSLEAKADVFRPVS